MLGNLTLPEGSSQQNAMHQLVNTMHMLLNSIIDPIIIITYSTIVY